ncbi:hypothetical protein B0J17DRAFT_673044 [Rhizoctonia solani]|nr:hypothetical protein B0J17DRAFT_673044 [Rhizoctonia solani]
MILNIMTQGHHIASQKLVQVPELLSIICTFLEPSERNKLASVSRSWFLAATPVIWREITGVHHLLALFPDAVIKSTGANTIMICLPPLLDFARFDIYAPLVRSLDLYGDSKHSYNFSEWSALNQRQSPLLPHLALLTMQGVCGTRGYSDQLLWTALLASPSLREFRAVSMSSGKPRSLLPNVSPVIASLLLGKLTSQCPDLQVLSIFPDSALVGTGSHKEGVFETFLMFSEPPFHHYFAQTQQLRELVTNEQILQNDVLPIVASLPLLEHLQIFTKSIDIDPDDIPLPENAFPSLRRLSLYLGSRQDTDDLWMIPALRQLTYLRIELRDQHSSDIGGTDWACDLLSTIAENSPNLRHLHVDFGLCSSCQDEPCDIGDLELFEQLSNLPLETVILGSAWFGPYDPEVYSYIATALPAVVDLRMPAQSGTLQELVHFAKLPRLQHLLLELDLSVGSDWNSPPTVPVGFALHTLETDDAACALLGDLTVLAKNLLLLWPNLQRVLYPASKVAVGMSLVRSTLVQSLNSSIMTVREATKLKKTIIEKYGLAESALFDALPTVDYPPPDLEE